MKYYGVVLFLLLVTSISCKKESETLRLFNGQNLENWHVDVPALDTIPEAESPFIIRNGYLVTLGTPRGHLITNTSYKNYRLEIEYRFVNEPGNCGVLVHASTPRALYQMFPKSIEVQMMHENAGDFWLIVEDITAKDMVARRGPKEEWGITEGKQRRIKNLTDNSEMPLGEWNSMTIEAYEDQLKVWVNDTFVNYGYNATARSGQIAIQAEGSEVAFRKIELTTITSISELKPN